MESAWPLDRANSRLLGTAFIVLILLVLMSIFAIAQETDASDDTTNDNNDMPSQETQDDSSSPTENSVDTEDNSNTNDESSDESSDETDTVDETEVDDGSQDSSDDESSDESDEGVNGDDENTNETEEGDNNEVETGDEDPINESNSESDEGDNSNSNNNETETNQTEINETEYNETETNETNNENEEDNTTEEDNSQGLIKMLVDKVIAMLSRLDLIENKQKNDSEKMQFLETELYNAKQDIEALRLAIGNDAYLLSGESAEADTPPNNVDISFSLPPLKIMDGKNDFPVDILITNTGKETFQNMRVDVETLPENIMTDASITEISELGAGETIVVRKIIAYEEDDFEEKVIEVQVEDEDGNNFRKMMTI